MNVKQPQTCMLDRREFLGGIVAAGSVVACPTLLPSIAEAGAPSRTEVVPSPDNPMWTGHVDDACGHWPPYDYPIPYDAGRAPEEAVTLAAGEANEAPFDYILNI